jgi:DNA-binding CsgD family transcriptional regulator/tetratricopeptide (TPR) repeat protein
VPRIPSPWTPELLERDEELTYLESLLSTAREGTGQLALIEGAAGIGKTRLLDSVRASAAAGDTRVLSARATGLEQEFPYGVVRQLFGPLLASAADHERASLSEGAAVAARLILGEDPDQSPTAADPSFATLNGLYWLTFNLSRTGPAVLTIDDLHWADTPSLQFLAFLVPRLDELPVLLATTVRLPEGEEQPVLGQLRAAPTARAISPQPLGEGSTVALLTGALGASPDSAFAEACHAQTGGNPFLLTELTRTLAAREIAPTAANASAMEELAPDAIVQSVLLRLESLVQEARDLARAVAVLGDGCEPPDAATLANLDPTGTTTARAADELRNVGIFESGADLRFVHPLVRNAIYSDIPAGARGQEHRRAAALLAERGAAAERIASHLLAIDPAGDEWVVRTLYEAAETALDQGAAQSAVTYLRRARREPPPSSMANEVLRLLLVAGDRSPDIAFWQTIEAVVIEAVSADPAAFLDAIPLVAGALTVTGKFDQAREIFERGIDAAERMGDLDRAVALEAQMSVFAQTPTIDARRRLQRYDGRLPEGTSGHRLGQALQAWWSVLLGEPAPVVIGFARTALAEGRIFAEQPGLIAPMLTVFGLLRIDEIDAATLATGHLIDKANRRGDAMDLATGWYLSGLAAYRRGELRSAAADARQALRLQAQHGVLWMIPLSVLLIDVLVARGELDEAEEILARAYLTGEIPPYFWFNPALYSRGLLRLAQGREREAADDLLDLLDRMDGWGVPTILGNPGTHAALALNALGETDRARSLADEDLAAARRWGAPSTIVESLTVLSRLVDGDQRVEVLREAVDLAETTPAKLPQPAALVELGSVYREQGEADLARPLLRRALDMTRRSGAAPLAQRAANELEALGEKVPHYKPIGVDALTPSERRVADMAADGMMNREIAAALYVTLKTVESHLRAAYGKLGIKSRRELTQALAEG